ncbi:MAG: ParB family transcriptional regulator, chromosome partitioning protein, partial [Actinomycetota bacterium]|nr:ParB family transcriptional regulator, chromosome partitioning protein [Actinomycetota bacterium]
MTERRRGLGRGLGALIPAAPTKSETAPSGPSPVDVLIPDRDAVAAAAAEVPAPVAGAHFAEIPVDAITPNPRQPRQVFDEDAM